MKDETIWGSSEARPDKNCSVSQSIFEKAVQSVNMNTGLATNQDEDGAGSQQNPLRQYNSMSTKVHKQNKLSRATDKSLRKELTKSLVEDASEDFSNIEEHINSTQRRKVEDASPQQNPPEPITGMNLKDQQNPPNYMASYQSRQQAVKGNLLG